MLLIKDDLFKHLNSDPPSTSDDSWRKKDAKTKGTINFCIEDSQIVHVKNLKTAKEIWDTLKLVHQRSSKLFLLRKLYSQKLNESGDMNHHINSILTLKDKLCAIGEEISEPHIVGTSAVQHAEII